jgi:predicted permease
MGTFAFDIRDALRSFRRDRAYAATVIVTLALTIGATTATFSIVNGVLLKPLAYRESHQLVALRETWRELADRGAALEVNERHFEYWREHASAFESLAQYWLLPANLTGRGEAAQVSVAYSSGTLFDVLQVPATLGRTLTPADEPEDAPDVATITDALWRQRFNADPAAIGGPLVLNGKAYTLVGVLPVDFQLPSQNARVDGADVFVPLRLTRGWVGEHNNQGLGRLRQGVTAEQARAELDVLQRQVGAVATERAHEQITLASDVTPLADYIVGRSRQGLLLLLAAIVAVLLIACSNLANLSLTRTLGRLREAAIRSALGAGRRRLIGKAILEQLLLSAIGGALGVWIAWMGLGIFVRTAPFDLPRVKEVALDGRVLVFAAVVSILAGVLVAILPAWRIAARDVQAALRANATAVASERGGLRAHATLLAAQVALSVTLLVVTALLAISFMRVLNIDRGFSAANVLAVDVALPTARYAEEPIRQAAYDRLLDGVRAVPGVEQVTTTSMLPLRGSGQVNFIVPDGTNPPPSERLSGNYRFIAPDFFRTLGIAVLRGRSFTDSERDPSRPAPALVSASTAARLWPGEDPIGKRFGRRPSPTGEQNFEVIGVVTDARTTALDRTPPSMVYAPYWWRSWPTMSLLIKSSVDSASILSGVRGVVHDVDPDIAVGKSRPLEGLVDASTAGRRYQTQLFVAFGAVALAIALVGVYAVTSYGISRRRREMNIRVALGARSSQVVALVLRQATTPVVAGMLIGAVGAIAVGGLVASLLFEVQARDPLIVAAVVAIVGSVGVATCGLAARRGLSLDPAAALRDE